jgi:O-acetyl-ADP-ribose deacetylase (regulator of RNase III)
MPKSILKLGSTVSLFIKRGSVLDFQHENGAIVNAANEFCLGGGGVDGAISEAGGDPLYQARCALPIVKRTISNDPIRCPTGQAKLTGPFQPSPVGSLSGYTLKVPYVIHAVGPDYNLCPSVEKGDNLLHSAYMESLERSKEAKIQAVAFSLLSAGVFRGPKSIREVLEIGLSTIISFRGYDELEEIHLYAFTSSEMKTLLDIAKDLGLKENLSTAD